jgi:hypothetical protein
VEVVEVEVEEALVAVMMIYLNVCCCTRCCSFNCKL